jgi:hypothetical protein
MKVKDQTKQNWLGRSRYPRHTQVEIKKHEILRELCALCG